MNEINGNIMFQMPFYDIVIEVGRSFDFILA
jgi:hypothetical protein